MITEEKKKCIVDEWIEISTRGTDKKYYEGLGYKKYRNEKGKLVYKIHPWELQHASGTKIKIKCPSCEEIRETYFRIFYKAKSALCYYCTRPTNDLIGKKFGRLTVIKDTGKRTKDRHIFWQCSCVCGNICEVDSSSLINGKTKSCGCLSRDKFINFHRKKGHFIKADHTEEEVEDYLNSLKDRAKDFKWTELSKELRKYGQCKICGTTANLVVHHLNSYYEFPEQRYDKDNLVVLCRGCHGKIHGKLNEITKQVFYEYMQDNLMEVI